MYLEGTEVSFEAIANDLEDGDISSLISWSSSLDGALGSGGSILVTDLSVGTHTVTAMVIDSTGQTSQSTVPVEVIPASEVFDGFSDSFESGDTSGWSSVAP